MLVDLSREETDVLYRQVGVFTCLTGLCSVLSKMVSESHVVLLAFIRELLAHPSHYFVPYLKSNKFGFLGFPSRINFWPLARLHHKIPPKLVSCCHTAKVASGTISSLVLVSCLAQHVF